jgi:hypothetical protein
LRKDDETSRKGFHHGVEHLLEFVTPHASENDHGLHVGFIHDFDDFLRRQTVPNPGGIIRVIVNVDGVKLGPPHLVRRDMKHRDGLKVLEK